MIVITIRDGPESATAEIPSAYGPALRSALAEIRDELGARSAGLYSFSKESAVTRAVAALATLTAAINAVVTREDRDYGQRRH